MTTTEALFSDARHGDSGAWTPQLWAILFVLGGALCLDALDVSMIGVALPSIRSALDLSTSSLQWIVSGYVLGYGGLLLLGGRAADLLGRRRVFLVALAVFAVVSLLGGLASDPGLLIAARFVKGVAAAFTAPASRRAGARPGPSARSRSSPCCSGCSSRSSGAAATRWCRSASSPRGPCCAPTSAR